MVLRVYKKGSAVVIIKDIERLVYNSLGKLEARYHKDNAYQWKSFERDKDYDSFALGEE